MARTIAITGGRGFIGRRLVAKHAALGDRVRVLSRKEPGPNVGLRIETFLGDLLSPELATLANFARGADVLYHCAAEYQDPSRMTAVNVEGTRTLLMAAAGHIGRWVQLSSLGIYGPMRSGVIREDTAPTPSGPYEASKLAADELVMDDAKRSGMQWTMLRPGIVFGRDMPNASVRAFLRAIRSGQAVSIGPPGAILPYVHVDDVVAALMLIGLHPRAVGEVFNICEDCTVGEFMEEAARLLGVSPPSLRLPEALVRAAAAALSWIPGFPLTAARIDALTRRTRYPSDKLIRTLGFRFETGWRLGLRETVAAH